MQYGLVLGKLILEHMLQIYPPLNSTIYKIFSKAGFTLYNAKTTLKLTDLILTLWNLLPSLKENYPILS